MVSIKYLKNSNIILLFIVLIFISCKKITSDGYKTYCIDKDKHSSNYNVQFIRYGGVYFYAIFDENVRYISKDPVNQYDINKLYGFSDCNNKHHVNSARFGWRWLNDNLEILAYVYNDGGVYNEVIDTIAINEEHLYQLIILDDFYEFTLDGKTILMNRTNSCNTGIYYKLYPYFGGDETAPHKVCIRIKEINGIK